MSSGIDFLMKKNKITPVIGTAKLLKGGKIEVTKKDGKEVIEAKHIIIATGARARSLPGVALDGEKIITSKEAMNLKEVPKTLTVVGAGAIGIEFAYFYTVLGTKVTVIEYLDSILPVEDREVSKVVSNSLKKRGVNIITGAAVKSVEKTAAGTKVTYDLKGKMETVESDKTLMAVGVTGNIESIGLEDLGIEVVKGHIKVDKDQKTNLPGVYAIGDVIGPPWLAHVASEEAILCVERIAWRDKKLHHEPIGNDTSTISRAVRTATRRSRASAIPSAS
jgi:dihydrolipoamide dehydrogenase